jgi:peroxiredoxin
LDMIQGTPMSQAEIASGRITPQDELPAKGRRLHDFELTFADGRSFHLYEQRARSNLVLVLADDQRATTELLSEMAARHEEFTNEEAEIIAIGQLPREECTRLRERQRLPFLVLADENGRVHHDFGASDPQGYATAAVYVTDRHGEVFGAYRTRDGQTLPTVAEILDWLEFINNQCPECEPPEWPL